MKTIKENVQKLSYDHLNNNSRSNLLSMFNLIRIGNKNKFTYTTVSLYKNVKLKMNVFTSGPNLEIIFKQNTLLLKISSSNTKF